MVFACQLAPWLLAAACSLVCCRADSGEQLRGELVDHNLVHARLVFACQVAPWSAASYKQLQALQFVAGLTQKAAVVAWCS